MPTIHILQGIHPNLALMNAAKETLDENTPIPSQLQEKFEMVTKSQFAVLQTIAANPNMPLISENDAGDSTQ